MLTGCCSFHVPTLLPHPCHVHTRSSWFLCILQCFFAHITTPRTLHIFRIFFRVCTCKFLPRHVYCIRNSQYRGRVCLSVDTEPNVPPGTGRQCPGWILGFSFFIFLFICCMASKVSCCYRYRYCYCHGYCCGVCLCADSRVCLINCPLSLLAT